MIFSIKILPFLILTFFLPIAVPSYKNSIIGKIEDLLENIEVSITTPQAREKFKKITKAFIGLKALTSLTDEQVKALLNAQSQAGLILQALLQASSIHKALNTQARVSEENKFVGHHFDQSITQLSAALINRCELAPSYSYSFSESKINGLTIRAPQALRAQTKLTLNACSKVRGLNISLGALQLTNCTLRQNAFTNTDGIAYANSVGVEGGIIEALPECDTLVIKDSRVDINAIINSKAIKIILLNINLTLEERRTLLTHCIANPQTILYYDGAVVSATHVALVTGNINRLVTAFQSNNNYKVLDLAQLFASTNFSGRMARSISDEQISAALAPNLSADLLEQLFPAPPPVAAR
jgi:hypothetical protein